MRYHRLIPAIFTFGVMVSSAQAEITVQTTYDDDIYYLGVPNSQTYGQTFTAAGPTLETYSFGLNNFGGVDQDLNFYIATWTGADVGTILWSEYFPSTFPNSGDVDYLVSPNLSLTTGDEYIAFISTSEANQSALSEISQNGSDDFYAGGQFLYLNNGTDTSQWYLGTWGSWYVPESAFTAEFSGGSTPSPAAALPMLGGLASIARSRKRASRRSQNLG